LAKAGFDTGRDNPAAPTHPPAQRQIRRLARRGVPAARRDADPIAAHLPRGRHAEPFFLDNAARWAAPLRDAAADVVTSERVAGHDDAMWREEFPLMVAWAFGG